MYAKDTQSSIRKFRFHISSFRNISFRYTEDFTLEDMGLDEEDWAEMSESEREQAIEDYGANLASRYTDWSAEEIVR